MQMSAAVRRNSVCGPGCPEIVAVDNGDIRHTPGAEAACLLPPGSRSLSGRIPRVFSVCTGPPSGPVISDLRIWPGCLWLAARQNFIAGCALCSRSASAMKLGAKSSMDEFAAVSRMRPHRARFRSRSFSRCLRLMSMRLCTGYRKLLPPFLGEVFLLCFS